MIQISEDTNTEKTINEIKEEETVNEIQENDIKNTAQMIQILTKTTTCKK